MRKITALLLAGLFLCLMIWPANRALGFGDYDSGSDFGYDSDWGSSSDWDSGSDWGSSSSSDYSSGSRSSRSSDRSSSSGKSDNSGAGIILIIFIVVIFVAIKIHEADTRGRYGRRSTRSPARVLKETPRLQPTTMDSEAYRKMRERDKGYSEEELFKYIKGLFTEMQTAWENGDISCIQDGFLPDTWQRFATQLKMKNQRGETTHVRDIAFQTMKVVGFKAMPAENRDKLQVRFDVAYNVWTTDRNKKNIQGTPATRHLMTYLWTMERPHDALTNQAPADAAHCPNCGAELDVTAFAECPFCHTQFRRETGKWLIRDIQAEAQKTL